MDMQNLHRNTRKDLVAYIKKLQDRNLNQAEQITQLTERLDATEETLENAKAVMRLRNNEIKEYWKPALEHSEACVGIERKRCEILVEMANHARMVKNNE